MGILEQNKKQQESKIEASTAPKSEEGETQEKTTEFAIASKTEEVEEPQNNKHQGTNIEANTTTESKEVETKDMNEATISSQSEEGKESSASSFIVEQTETQVYT